MTVAEIKEYIDEWKEYYKSYAFIGKGEVDKTLDEIKGLLDELEPKAKWKIDGHHRRCEKCGEYFCIDDREGNEIPHNFCGNCGARMEVEKGE